MRFVKADWILPAFVFTPMVVLGGMLVAASWAWGRNTSQQQNLMGDLIQRKPVLKAVGGAKDSEQIRSAYELIVGAAQLLDWQEICFESNNGAEFGWICHEELSEGHTNDLRKLLAKSEVLKDRIRRRINSPKFSVDDLDFNAFTYSAFEYGSIESNPVWLLEESLYLELQDAVIQENSDRVFVAVQELIELLVPREGQPIAWDSVVYLPRALSNLRAIAASELLDAKQLGNLDRTLSVTIDWETSSQQKRSERLWLAEQLLKRPSVLRKSGQLVQMSYRDRKAMRDQNDHSYAPSETLAIMRSISGATPQSQGAFRGIDQWLKPTWMASLSTPNSRRNYLGHYNASVQIAATDRLFARAAIAIARLKIEKGDYPKSPYAFAKLGWSQEDIAEAEKQFEFGISTRGVRLTSRNAEWIRDVDDHLLDRGFSKQVHFGDLK